MSKYIGLLIGIFLMPFLDGASAEGLRTNGEPPNTLSLAISTALRLRPEIRTHELMLAKAKYRIDQVNAGFLPNLEFVSNLTNNINADEYTGVTVRADINGEIIEADVSRTAPDYQMYSAIELSYDLYSGGKTNAQLDKATAEYDLVHAEAEIVRNNIIIEVTRAYRDLCLTQLHEKQLLGTAELASSRKRIAAKELSTGHISRLEKEEIELESRIASLELKEVRSDLEDQWQKFRAVIGWSTAKQYESVSMPILLTPTELEVIELIDTVPTQQLELMRYSAKKQMATAAQEEIKAETRPQVEMYGLYSAVGRDEGNAGDAISDMERSDVTVGLRVKWNLYDGGEKSAQEKMRQIDVDLEDLNLRKSIDNLTVDYHTKKEAVNKALAKLELAKRSAELTEKKLVIAQRKRVLEQLTEIDYFSVENDWRIAHIDVEVAELELMVARVELRLAKFKTRDAQNS